MAEHNDGPQPLVGRVLSGTYRVEQLLGRGGMGTVYQATNVRLDKRVALKVLASHVGANADAVAQLEREARIASAVGHAHIVDVIDFNVGEGVPYMVMELLEGEDLEQLLGREQCLPLARVAAMVRQIAAALDAVHARGVVHRDLKPANVFLCAGRGADFVKVLDFGVSRAATLSSISVAQGSVVGSPHYMAPEQCVDDLGEVGPWTDVYGLGALTYRMLGGRAPFAHHNSMTKLLYAVLHDDVPPLEAHGEQLLGGRRDGAAQLDAVLARAMAKHPAARMQSARELAEALEALARGEAVAPEAGRSSGDVAGAAGVATAKLPREAAPDAQVRQSVPPTIRQTRARADAERAGEDSAARAPSPRPRRRGKIVASLIVLLLLGGAGVATYALWPRSGRPCHADDRDDCRLQCARAHQGSCSSWLRMLASVALDKTAPRDAKLLERLCRATTSEGAAATTTTTAGACFELARRTTAGGGAVTRDLAQAALLFRRACSAKHAAACARAGRMYLDGSGVAADIDRARTLLASACEAKIARACHDLGRLHASAGPRQDLARAASLQRRACEQRVAEACYVLAAMHERGDGVTRDGARASQLYQSACTLGHAPSCDAAKRHLALSAWGDWARAAVAKITRLDVKGPLAKQVVSRPLSRRLAQITFCYQQQLLRDRTLAGALELGFDISARGRVQRARVLSSELRGRKVGPCVVRLSRRWRFEPPRFGARASVTLALRFSARLALASARPPSKPAMPASPSKPYGERQGWVYLGEYSGGRWRTRYFKIAAGTEPAKLAGRTLASIGRCNVRSAPPSVVGIMGRVVGGLPAGSKVAVTRVQRWLDSGFIWARVRAH